MAEVFETGLTFYFLYVIKLDLLSIALVVHLKETYSNSECKQIRVFCEDHINVTSLIQEC